MSVGRSTAWTIFLAVLMIGSVGATCLDAAIFAGSRSAGGVSHAAMLGWQTRCCDSVTRGEMNESEESEQEAWQQGVFRLDPAAIVLLVFERSSGGMPTSSIRAVHSRGPPLPLQR